MLQQQDTFNFWCPVETIEKANQPTDYKNMRLKGVASTDDEDLDREIMLNKGFIVDYLLERGFVNWHHQSRTIPSAIIGEPELAEITTKGLYVEAKLYDTPVAREAYDLAKVLQRQSKRRRLGWSIEGKVVERSLDKGTIKKSIVTGLALTPAPKNPNTFAVIAKAFTDEETAKSLLQIQEESSVLTNSGEYDFEFNTEEGTYLIKGNKLKFQKALSAGYSRGGERETGTNLGKESLEKDVKRSKVLTKIFRKYPAIKFEKAVVLCEHIMKKAS